VTAVFGLLRLIPIWTWALALVSGWALWNGHQLAAERFDAASEHAAQAAEVLRQSERARAEEQRRIQAQSEIAHDAQLQADAARADADRARVLAGRLRQLLAARPVPAGSDTTSAPASPAATSPDGVLADLLGRVGELAQYADLARVAGQACVKSYDTLTEKP
jgi:hypothetical protein